MWPFIATAAALTPLVQSIPAKAIRVVFVDSDPTTGVYRYSLDRTDGAPENIFRKGDTFTLSGFSGVTSASVAGIQELGCFGADYYFNQPRLSNGSATFITERSCSDIQLSCLTSDSAPINTFILTAPNTVIGNIDVGGSLNPSNTTVQGPVLPGSVPGPLPILRVASAFSFSR